MQEDQFPTSDDNKFFSIRKKHFFISGIVGILIIGFALWYLILHGLYIGFTPPAEPPPPLSQELISRFNQLEDQLNKAINDVNEIYQLKEKLNSQLPKKDDNKNKGNKGGRYLPINKLNLAEDNYELSSSFEKIELTILQINEELPYLKKNLLNTVFLNTNLPEGIPLIGEYKISSGFGERQDPFNLQPSFHPGVDISSDMGTPVLAAANGVIKKITPNTDKTGYGNYIEISHPNGVSTLYGHLSEILVKENQTIRRGEIVGLVGDTGRSTGPHLHFEVQVAGTPIDPLSFMSPIKMKPNTIALSALSAEIKAKCAPLLVIVKDEKSKIFKDCLANKGTNVKNTLLANQNENAIPKSDSTLFQNECTYIDENKRLQVKNSSLCTNNLNRN